MDRSPGVVQVLVVGAGPTGLALGGELARLGVRCRVIDKLPAPSPLSKALGVQARTLDYLERIGVIDRAEEGRRRRPGPSWVSPGQDRHGRSSGCLLPASRPSRSRVPVALAAA